VKVMTSEKYDIKKLLTDGRVFGLLLIILTAVPYITPIAFPITVGPWTQDAFDIIDTAPPGSNILICMSFSPGGWGESGYQAKAFVAHALTQGQKVFFIADPSSPEGVMMAERVISELRDSIVDPLGKVYGVDWVNLGVVAGGAPTARQLALDFHATIQSDHVGTSLTTLAISKDIQNYQDFLCVFEPMTGPGFPAKEEWCWILGIPYIQGTQYLTITRDIADWQAGLFQGFIPGQRGAAEYEYLAGIFMDATKALGAVNMSHIFAIIVLALGNGYYWLVVRKEEK
jgi:hypothetical protein